MKKFGTFTFALMTFSVISMMLSKPALANEYRIYMGLTIPQLEDVENCNPNEGLRIPDIEYPLAFGANIGDAGFNSFLDWVNGEYGGEGHLDFGYTVTSTQGYYQGAAEQSKVMLLFFAQETAIAIGTRFQQAFCQDSVYVHSTAIAESVRIPALEVD